MALRSAQRRFLRGGVEVDQLDETCALLCGACGRFDWADPAGQPHRRDERSLRRTSPCTHCGARDFIDLGRERHARELCHSEQEAAQRRREAPRWIAARAFMGALLGGVASLMFADPPWITSGVALLGALLAGLHARRQSRSSGPERRALPTRWAMALPPAGRSTAELCGRVELGGSPLTAPLTGRGCAGFEVAARFHGSGDAWALIEQRVGNASVAGRRLAESTTHLALERERLGFASELVLDASAQAYLRRRGLSPTESSLVVYESILRADTPVRVERYAGGATVRRANELGA